jgi:group I intron endonuclease
MTDHVLYRITCLGNGKSYVGRTSNPERRKREHFRALECGDHRNAHLQNAYRKFGRHAFTWVVMGRFESEAALRAEEQYFIDALWAVDALFNLAKSADGGGYAGRVVSVETRARMSAARRAYLADPAVRRNLSEKHKGKVLTPEHRAKLSAAKRKAQAVV